MITPREAILRAADQIEQHPETFNFWLSAIPQLGCRTPGCALGWIGAFSGQAGIHTTARHFLGIEGYMPDKTFYSRMNNLNKDIMEWTSNAGSCARTLRLYADKYHPAPSLQPPDWNAVASQPYREVTLVDCDIQKMETLA